MGFKQGIRAFLLSIAILASTHAPAAVLDNFYLVQLAQEEEQTRNEAMAAATVVMLQRLAGNDVSLKQESIANALTTPQELMSQIGSTENGELRIQFDPDALNRVLRQAEQPLLGPNRPGILLWAVVAGELGDRTLHPMMPEAQVLKQAAQHRGVGLSFPLGDLQDMSLVNEELIRQANREQLLQASERYPTEGTLALIISGPDDQAELNWTLWLNEQHKSGRITGAVEKAADELMLQLASLVFDQYSIPVSAVGEHTEWLLQVDGVDSVAAYSGLLGMLRQLGTQQQPKLLKIDGDRVILQVEFPGSEEQLIRLLDLDMRLQRIAEPMTELVTEQQHLLPLVEPDDVVEEREVEDNPPLDSFDPSVSVEHSIDNLEGTAPGDTLPLAEPVQAIEPVAPALPTLYFRWRG